MGRRRRRGGGKKRRPGRRRSRGKVDLSDAKSLPSNANPATVKGTHGDFKSRPHGSEQIAFRDAALLKDHSGGGGASDAELVFFLA
jgi:hypothetical protein